jgi:trimethylamine:corrinoid methyltransferase-like protein
LDKEQYFPKLSNRDSREVWAKAGEKDLWAVARERAKEILHEHQPEPLDPSVEMELSSIVKEVEKRELKG